MRARGAAGSVMRRAGGRCDASESRWRGGGRRDGIMCQGVLSRGAPGVVRENREDTLWVSIFIRNLRVIK